jgi:hypothetical protein
MAESKIGGEKLVRVDHNQLLNKRTNSHSAIDGHIANTSNPHNVTATQVGKDTAQWNADRIKGKSVDDTAIAEGKTLVYDSVTQTIKYLDKVKIATGTYTGNGSSQSITCSFGGKNFQPKYIEIVDVSGTVYRSIKIDTMNGSDYMRSQNSVGFAGNSVVWVTSGQGITITSTGFSVGNEPSINNNGDTYRWIALG